MSTTIDQRVVEMRFDNSHFEKNVSTTMSTLEKLKAKLNLSGASKGLNDINAAARGFGNTGFAGAVDTVTARFSALQVMGVTALANITNSAINAGKNIVKSLTIDPIKTGFQEYETKMGSIQTILANTEHQGTTMDDVTAALEELNLYADKTIYNFQEMTRNIGTFTAAGVDLDTSVRSIQGIANLAAVSGSTSQQASTAMYQLSQALATGTVKLMDWNSVVNAGMGGKVFQNALIRTAAMLDGSAKNVEAWQKKNIDAFGSFRDSLTQGEWLTSEVLTRTLEQFTMAAEEGSEAWNEYKKSLMDDGYTEKQAEEILKMANTATDAATKVKTFTQLLDTLKESAQSGWAQTWELLVGDFVEAKEFFTELSDLFGGIIGDSANRRNSFFTDVFSSNWSKLISQINEAGIKTEKFEDSIRKVVGDNKLDSLVEKYGSIQKAAEEGAISSNVLKKALDGIGMTDADDKISGFVDGLKEIERTLRRGNVGEDVKKLQTALNELGYDLGDPGIDGIIGPITEKAIKAFQEANDLVADGVAGPDTIAALEKAGTKVGEITGDVDGLKESCDSLVDVITQKSGRELLLGSLLNIIKAIQRPLSAVGEAFRNTFSISPDTLYRGLEKLEKLTSKLVPKGLLDIAKWDELTGVLNTFGISTREFTLKLQEVLADHGVDVAKLRDKYGSLANAFNEGAISIEHIKEALLDFEGITETMLLSGETGEKIRKTFEGLFAIFDIIGTLAGSGLKIAFEVLSGVLAHFDMDILDLTANIADSIIKFRDWLESIIDVSGAVEAIMPYVEKVGKALGEFFKDIPNMDSFKNLVSVLDNAATAFTNWIETLKTSKDLPGDIIAGLVSGLTSGAGAVLSAALKLAWDIITGICNALGINSPSTKMIEIGENTVEGLIIGLQNGASGLWETIKGIGTKLIEWFKNIDFGAIFGVSVGASMVWLVKKIGDALSILAVPFAGFGSMLEDLGDMFEGIGAKFKAEAWESRANAIKSFAIAIAILAASVWVLAQIDHDALVDAVHAVAGLATVMSILTIAIGKFGSAKGLEGVFSGVKFGGIATALMGLSTVLVAIAFVAKQLGELSPEQTAQAFESLGKVLLGLLAALGVCGLIVRGEHSKNISKIGGLMIKLSIALLLMAGVVKVINKLTDTEINNAVSVIEKFLVFIGAVAVANLVAGKNVSKIGSTMIKLGIALALMVGVVKLINKLTEDEINKAVAVIGKYLIFVAAIAVLSAIPGTAKIGGSLLGVTIALALMVGTVKLIGQLTSAEINKAIDVVGKYLLFVAAIALISMIPGTSRIAGTLLAMSVAIGVLAGVVALMGLLKEEQINNGLKVVTVLGVVMAAMIWAARGVGNCMGELIVMTVAVAVLAGIVAALSFIDPGPLWNATLAMSLLMGMFAIVAKASSNINTSWGTMTAMAGIILILSGILYLLAGQPWESVISAGAALSILLLSLAGSLKILSTIKSVSIGAFAAMGLLVLIVGALAVVLGLLTALDCAPSIETAASISILLLAMAGVYAILGATGGLAGTAVAGAVGMMAVIAIIGGIALAIGALMSLIPEDKISEWKTGLENFMDFITILATGLGEAIGGLVGGVLEGVSGGIETFSGSLGKLTEAIGPFAEAAKQLDAESVAGVNNLVDLVTAITASNFVEKMSAFIFGGSSMDTFATQLKSFGKAMKDYAAEVVGLDTASISNSVSAAQGIVSVAQTIPGDGLLGLDGIDDFGRNIKVFGTALKEYSTEVAGVDSSVITNSVTAAKSLIEIAKSIPSDGFLGLDGIDDFGRNIKTFGKGLSSYAKEVAEINSSAVTNSVTAAKGLVQVAQAIPDDGTLGMDGIDDFGKNIKSFGKSMKAYAESVADIDTNAVGNSIIAARRLSTFISQLSSIDTSGVDSFKSAVKSLSKVNVGALVDAFSSSASKLTSVGSNMATAIIDGLKSKLSQMKATTAVMVAETSAMVSSKAPLFGNAGKQLGANLVKGFSSQRSTLISAITTIVNAAAMGARSYYSTFYSAGSYLVTGFAAGITDNTYRAEAKARAMASAAAQAAREALQINSPSKIFMGIGSSIPEGFALGIDKFGGYVSSSINDMAVGAIDETNNALSRIADVINSDIDTQPTIRPVLDLSDVETGASAISSMFNNGTSMGVLANVNGISAMMNRRSQNGANDEVVSAIDKLRKDIGSIQGNSVSIGGVSYEDGSSVGNAVLELVRAMRVEGRI